MRRASKEEIADMACELVVNIDDFVRLHGRGLSPLDVERAESRLRELIRECLEQADA